MRLRVIAGPTRNPMSHAHFRGDCGAEAAMTELDNAHEYKQELSAVHVVVYHIVLVLDVQFQRKLGVFAGIYRSKAGAQALQYV